MEPAFKVGDFVGERGKEWTLNGYKPSNIIYSGPYKIVEIHQHGPLANRTFYTYTEKWDVPNPRGFLMFSEPNDKAPEFWFKWPTVDGKPSTEYKVGDAVPQEGGKRIRRSKSKSRKGRKGRKGRKTTRRH